MNKRQVRSPPVTAPADANRVVPNRDAADALFAAIEANQQLVLTGKTSQGDGTVAADPTQSPTPEPTESADVAQPTTPADSVALPSSIAGQTAAEETCSNGNLR